MNERLTTEEEDDIRRTMAAFTREFPHATGTGTLPAVVRLLAELDAVRIERDDAQTRLTTLWAFNQGYLMVLRRMLAERPLVRGEMTMEATALAAVLALFDAVPSESTNPVLAHESH